MDGHGDTTSDMKNEEKTSTWELVSDARVLNECIHPQEHNGHNINIFEQSTIHI